MLKIFVDSDMDFTPALAEKYGFGLISMPYCIDGKTIYPYEDGNDVDLHEFYDGLRDGILPTTGGISSEKYKLYFRPEFEKGNDVLYVHFSESMTCTFIAMREAIDELKKEFPDRKFYEIDTKGITIISYNIACEIGDMYLAGKSVEEMLEWANVEVNKFSQYFFADDLKFFRRSGRVSGVSAVMGTMLGIRPIIYMSEDGKMISIGKERGRQKAMDRLLAYVDELGEDVEKHRVIIGHTDSPELAAELENAIKQKFPAAETVTLCTNPTAGSHCGPNGAGICFHSKNR